MAGYRMPSGIPAYVRRELGLVARSGHVLRPGQWISAEHAARMLDAMRTAFDASGVEYEVGVDYDAAVQSSDVSWNARVHITGRTLDDVAAAARAIEYYEQRGVMPRGFDAQVIFETGLTVEEVREAIAEFAATGHIPRGITIESVDWRRSRYTPVSEWAYRRARRVARDGTADDLWAFRAIIQRVGPSGIRVGRVKRT